MTRKASLNARPTPSTAASSINNSRNLRSAILRDAVGKNRHGTQSLNRHEPNKGILKKSTVYPDSSESDQAYGGFTAEMQKARRKLRQTKSISFHEPI